MVGFSQGIALGVASFFGRSSGRVSRVVTGSSVEEDRLVNGDELLHNGPVEMDLQIVSVRPLRKVALFEGHGVQYTRVQFDEEDLVS